MTEEPKICPLCHSPMKEHAINDDPIFTAHLVCTYCKVEFVFTIGGAMFFRNDWNKRVKE